MSEWDTGERSESVFFRWSMLQDNVVSLVALELTASKLCKIFVTLWWDLHTDVDSNVAWLFFFEKWCIRGAAVGVLGRLCLSLVGSETTSIRILYHSALLFCFYSSWMTHQRKCSGTIGISHMRIGL